MDWYKGGCRLCPRECGADRSHGRMGVCRETAEVRVARAALHFWEEPCISGEEGSGAVFFAGCSLRCIYCQNYEISGGLPDAARSSCAGTGAVYEQSSCAGIGGILRGPGTSVAHEQSFFAGTGGTLRGPGTGAAHERFSFAGTGGTLRGPGTGAAYEQSSCAGTGETLPLGPGDSVTPEQSRCAGAGGASVGVCPGKVVTVPQLASVFLSLQAQGANNINLVTACHFVPQVREALLLAKKNGLGIPVVYNSSGYEKTETLRLLEGLVDIYLPDFKYLDESLAARYSKAPDYPAIAAAALAEMVRQCPEPVFDAQGRMQKGVIVRHLLLPGHVREAKRVARYLHETYGNRIYISLLNQYTPEPAVREDPLLGRKVTRREYARLLDYAVGIGIEQGFFQEDGTAAGSYTPAFDNTGVE